MVLSTLALTSNGKNILRIDAEDASLNDDVDTTFLRNDDDNATFLRNDDDASLLRDDGEEQVTIEPRIEDREETTVIIEPRQIKENVVEIFPNLSFKVIHWIRIQLLLFKK
jgi:hypothetical protein